LFPNEASKPLFQAKFLKVGKVGKKERIIVVYPDAMYLLDKQRILEK